MAKIVTKITLYISYITGITARTLVNGVIGSVSSVRASISLVAYLVTPVTCHLGGWASVSVGLGSGVMLRGHGIGVSLIDLKDIKICIRCGK